MPQPLRSNPIGHSKALTRKYAMDMSNGDVHRYSNLKRIERRLRQMGIDIVCDAGGEFGQPAHPRGHALSLAGAGCQDMKVGFNGRSRFFRSQSFCLVEE